MSYDNYYRDMAIERGKIIQKVEAERDEARASYREALATIRRLDRSAEDIRDLVRSVIGTSADESNVEVVRRLVDHLFDAERDALNRAADELQTLDEEGNGTGLPICVDCGEQVKAWLRERAKRVPSDVIADLRARLAELEATRVVSVPFVSANEAANPQSDTHTDAQAAALDEATKAVAVAIAEFHIEFMGARKTTATLARVTSASMKQAAAAARAAEPIIRRQAEAERDEWRTQRDAADENRRHTEQQNMELLAEIRDLRTRLAAAEQDALNRAADELPRSGYVPGSSVAIGTDAVAEWLRERAKAAGAAQAEPGEEPDMRVCNGTVIAGGAIHHTTLCPMHGEAPEVRAARAYDRRRRAGIIFKLRARLAAAERAQADAEWELSNMRAAHDSACRTVADMHAAAVGAERSGPIRGVVEDVADVRAHLDGMRDKFRRLAAEISTGWEPLEQEGGLVYTAYKNAFKEAARRINVILEEES